MNEKESRLTVGGLVALGPIETAPSTPSTQLCMQSAVGMREGCACSYPSRCGAAS